MKKINRVVAGVATVAGVLSLSNVNVAQADTTTRNVIESSKTSSTATQQSDSKKMIEAKRKVTEVQHKVDVNEIEREHAQTRLNDVTNKRLSAQTVNDKAQTDVDSAKRLKNDAQEQLNSSNRAVALEQQKVNDAQSANDIAIVKSVQAKSDLNKAEQTQANATPEKIRNIKDAITNTNGNIKNNQVTSQKLANERSNVEDGRQVAQNNVDQGNAEVAVDKASIENIKNDVKNKQLIVRENNSKVKNSQRIIDSAVSVESSDKQAIIVAQNSKENVQTMIAKKKHEDATIAASLNEITDKLVAANTAVKKNQLAQKQARAAVDKTNADIISKKSFLNDNVKNTITVPSDLWIRLVGYENTRIGGLGVEEVAKLGRSNYTPSNTYHHNEADVDNTFTSLDDLSFAQRLEITQFAADLINQIHRQMNTTKVVVTDDSLEFADDIAKEYLTDGYNLHDYTHTPASGAFPDDNELDKSGIKRAATENGLTANEDDSIFVYYDTASQNQIVKGANNIDQVKEGIYNTVYHMMFDDGDSNWINTLSLSGIDLGPVYDLSTRQNLPLLDNAFLGVGINSMGQVHFGLVPNREWMVVNPNKFNVNAEQLNFKTDSSAINNEIKSLQQLLAAQQTTLDIANQSLASSQLSAQGLQAKQSDLKNKKELIQIDVSNLDLKLTTANKQIDNAQKKFKKDKDNIKNALAQIADFKNNLNVSQVYLTNSQNALKDAQIQLIKDQTVVNQRQQVLEEFIKKVQALSKSIVNVRNAIENDQAHVVYLQSQLKNYQDAPMVLQSMQKEYNDAMVAVVETQKSLSLAKMSLSSAKNDVSNKQALLVSASKVLSNAMNKATLAKNDLDSVIDNVVKAKRNLGASQRRLTTLEYELDNVQSKASIVRENAQKVTVLRKADKNTGLSSKRSKQNISVAMPMVTRVKPKVTRDVINTNGELPQTNEVSPNAISLIGMILLGLLEVGYANIRRKFQ